MFKDPTIQFQCVEIMNLTVELDWMPLASPASKTEILGCSNHRTTHQFYRSFCPTPSEHTKQLTCRSTLLTSAAETLHSVGDWQRLGMPKQPPAGRKWTESGALPNRPCGTLSYGTRHKKRRHVVGRCHSTETWRWTCVFFKISIWISISFNPVDPYSALATSIFLKMRSSKT